MPKAQQSDQLTVKEIVSSSSRCFNVSKFRFITNSVFLSISSVLNIYHRVVRFCVYLCAVLVEFGCELIYYITTYIQYIKFKGSCHLLCTLRNRGTCEAENIKLKKLRIVTSQTLGTGTRFLFQFSIHIKKNCEEKLITKTIFYHTECPKS